jgi:hypothetical protein
LYSQIPISASASGDFVVSRAGNTASRILGNGNIETGVLANIARINYPRTGVASGCAGLLVEPSAQNLALRSDELSVSGTWAISNNTQITANTTGTTDPAGSTLSDLIFCQASGTAAQGLTQSISISTSGTYTMSIFVKKASNFDWFRIQFQDPTSTVYQAYYNLVSGTLGAVDAGSTATITSFGNGWYRVTHSRSTASGSVSFGLRLANANSSLTVPCDGTSGVYAWGAQLETGSIATSYIPTTTAAVTRNSDVITNNQFVIPNLIGAILTEFESPTSGTYFVDNLPVTLVSGYNKVAISYTPTTITVYRNGTQVSGSPFSPPGGVLPILGNVINIGHNNQYYQLGANIRSFVLYSSTLTAAEASGLTT